MGNIYKRPRKTGGTVYYGDYWRNGRRIQVSLRTSNFEVAKARLRDLELATTDSGPHATQALADCLDYFTGIACAAKPDATRSSYEQKARHLARIMGDVEIGDLDRARVERYIAARLEEGAHPHSVHKELVVLRGALKNAEARGAFRGIVEKVVPRFKPQYEPRTAHLTPEQFTRLMTFIVQPAHDKAKPETIDRVNARRANRTLWCLLIALASPRKGEVEKMTWQASVDLARGVLHVPKGKTKPRTVPIHPVLRPWLEALRQPAGQVVEPWTNVCTDLKRACLRAGVPRVTPNDLRRTFATWLKQRDVDSAVVAAMMGHSSTAMVDRVYGKLDEATYRRAIARLPRAIPVEESPAAEPGQSHTGVTVTPENGGTHGTPGTSVDQAANSDSVEESTNSGDSVVRAVGLEPTTSGLRVRCSTIELCPRLVQRSSIFSESGATRTPDLRVRSPALYPTELRTLVRGRSR